MANVSLGRAVLVLATETGSFITDLDNAGTHAKKLEQAVDSVGKGLKGVGKGMTEFGTSLTTTVSGPIAAVVGGLAALALNAISTGDLIAKQAREAGLGAQSWQELSFALGQVAKVSDEELVKGFASLTSAIGEASAGSKQHIELLRALGFSQAEIKAGTIDTEEAFTRFTAAVQRAESPAQALTFAGDLLGDRVGRKLAGALRESGDEVDALRQQFNDLGLGMSGEALDASENLNDQIDVMKRQFGALGREIGAQVLPIIMETLIPFLRDTGIPIIKRVADMVATAVQWFSTLPKPVQEGVFVFAGLAAAIGPVLVVAGTLITSIGTIVSAFSAVMPVVTAVGGVIAALGAGPLLVIVGAIGAVVAAWYYWDEIGPIVKRVYEAVKTWLVDKFTWIVDRIKFNIDLVTGAFKWMYDKVVGQSFVPDMVDGIGAHFKRLDKEMTDKADKETKKTADKFKKLHDELLRQLRDIERADYQSAVAMRILAQGLDQVGQRVDPLPEKFFEFRDALKSLDAASQSVTAIFQATGAGLDQVGERVEATIPKISSWKDKLLSIFGGVKEGTSDFLGGFSDLFGNVFRNLFGGSGGGGVLAGIVESGLTTLGNVLFPGFGNLLSSLTPIITDGLKALGQLFADFFSWIWDGFKKIFSFFGGGGPAIPGESPEPPPGPFPAPGGGAGGGLPPIPPINLPEFAHGTGGQYFNFGDGMIAALHGWEKITPLGAEDGGDRTTIVEVDGYQLFKFTEARRDDALRGRQKLRAT